MTIPLGCAVKNKHILFTNKHEFPMIDPNFLLYHKAVKELMSKKNLNPTRTSPSSQCIFVSCMFTAK